MTFLTQLTNQLGIPVVFIGTLSVLPQVQRTARMARRSVGPACALWEPRITVERETHSAATGSARQAFDDLFK